MIERRIDMTHGSGGRAQAKLLDELFRRAFDNPFLAAQNDFAAFSVCGGNMVMSTDAYVISPLFFPGGDIGCLSVHGTINDLAMSGAMPLYLSASFILEEGLLLSDLERIVASMAHAACRAGVAIVTGDTKVVERGKGDGVFITTTGIGIVPEGIVISGDRAKVGDHVIVSGTMGDHGIAVMAHRHHLQFQTHIQSDTASLHNLVRQMLQVAPHIHCLRDPTRGGLATTLNEIAVQSKVSIHIDERCIPIQTEVASACELLGLDALYVANEGKLVVICPPECSDALLDVMRSHEYGLYAALIGEVVDDPKHWVVLKTKLGGRRIVDWLSGEQLPRIC